MKKRVFKILALANKMCLPSYSKRELDLSRATPVQKAIIGWRTWITKRALD